jgi:23S rRNA (uridine2552-2'-O)-methyltransferase
MTYKPQDRYFKKAKQEGYRSRAAYKLLELQQRYRIMKPGDSIVDLGAAPGGWLQVAARIVGQQGKVIGVDLQAIQPLPEGNVVLLRGDITSDEIRRQIKQLIAGPAHCVLSDMAPKLTGIRDADTARCLELNRTALAVAIELLGSNGSLVVKSFVSNDLQIFTAELKQYFGTVQRSKPEATRHGSSEFYFFANGFRPRTPNERQTTTDRNV